MGFLKFMLGALILAIPFAVAYWAIKVGKRNDDDLNTPRPYDG
jgi:hypothetical protein